MTYQEEYKRWAATDLQDFDLNRELREIAGMTRRSATALLLR